MFHREQMKIDPRRFSRKYSLAEIDSEESEYHCQQEEETKEQ